jgi:rhamnogalacturonyl hydrolase YesR
MNPPEGRRILAVHPSLRVLLMAIFSLNVFASPEGSSGNGSLAALEAPNEHPPRVLVVGMEASVEGALRQELARFAKQRSGARAFELRSIPSANPSGEPMVFPPAGVAYRTNAASHALWRALFIEAPDLVVAVGSSDFGLGAALTNTTVRLVPGKPWFLDPLIKDPPQASPLGMDRLARLSRTPRALAVELSATYGKSLSSPVYIPAMALIARLRLGDQAEVEKLVLPYLDGTKDSLAKATTSHLSGHLIFAELAQRGGDLRLMERVRAAADLAARHATNSIFWAQMSDGAFMGIPILAKAGRLTGEASYFDAAEKLLRTLQALCLRPDGLWRHSPLCEVAWGRGNGFPALGLALALDDIPESHPARPLFLRSFREHLEALARHQDASGMWRQVIDEPRAYRELTSTCMISVALLRGARRGWLDASLHQRAIDRAWEAVKARSLSGGVLIDVCEGTGKMKKLEEYLLRGASFARDDRGGAMVMLFATEMMEETGP